MYTISQRVLATSVRVLVIVFSVLMAQLAMPSAEAAGSDCPCFSTTIIDAALQEFGPARIKSIENNTGASVTCYDSSTEINTFLSFRDATGTPNYTFFTEPNTDGTLACGWGQSGGSGRPLEPITAQEARDCSSQITQSTAWRILACPNSTAP